MITTIPIIFAHFGYDEYLNITIRQALSSNPAAEVILLGDEANRKFNTLCSHYLYKDFETGIDDLEKTYTQSSSNNYQYEFFCIKRWFIIRNFMREKKLDWVFATDSDVLLYNSIQDYFTTNILKNKYEAAYCLFEQTHDQFRWVASGANAFVSLDFLEKFCDYVVDIYKQHIDILSSKIEHHSKANVPGGIADMTFFYLYHYYKKPNILNLLTPAEDEVFSHGIYFKNGIYMAVLKSSFHFPEILLEKGKPFFVTRDQQKIFFQSLHFQGGYKNDILKFYTGKKSAYITKLKLLNFCNAAKIKFKVPLMVSKLKAVRKGLVKVK